MTERSDRPTPTEEPATSGRPGLVHVSELLAAHGRSAPPAGGRRRRAVEQTPDQQTPDQQTPEQQTPEQQTPEQETVAQETAAQETAADEAPAQDVVVEPEPGAAPVPVAESAPEPVQSTSSAPEQERTAGGVGEWALVAGQLVGALVVGAALWFGFRYLWDQVPVLAAVLATLLTIGLVVGVRGLRHDTDLLSSALALVAGLVVAFSPPVLALTGG